MKDRGRGKRVCQKKEGGFAKREKQWEKEEAVRENHVRKEKREG